MLHIEHPVRTATRLDGAAPAAMGATLFVALELSLWSWVVAAGAPGGDEAGKRSVAACDGPGLLALLGRLRLRAERRCRCSVAVVVVQEAGRDGFWAHRLLGAHGVQGHVAAPSSVAVNRRGRRAKTDRIDAEAVPRTLMARARGGRQVCATVRPPSRGAEDARRIKGRLATQGVFGFEPTLRGRRARLAAVRTPEGAASPPRLAGETGRQVDRLELAVQQLAAGEAARNAALAAGCVASPAQDAAGTVSDGASGTAASLPRHEGPGARPLHLRGSALRRLRCWRVRRCSAISAAGARPRPMRALHQAHGRAAASTTGRAPRRRAAHGCARPWGSWPGRGCATRPTVRRAPGVASGSATDAAASGASPSRRWRANCPSHCGASSPTAWCRPAPC